MVEEALEDGRGGHNDHGMKCLEIPIMAMRTPKWGRTPY
jgi:hypothetical protein